MTERRKPGAPPLYWALISEATVVPSPYGGRYRFYTSVARDEFVRRAQARMVAKQTGQRVEVGHDLPPPRRMKGQGMASTAQNGRCPCCGQMMPSGNEAKGG